MLKLGKLEKELVKDLNVLLDQTKHKLIILEEGVDIAISTLSSKKEIDKLNNLKKRIIELYDIILSFRISIETADKKSYLFLCWNTPSIKYYFDDKNASSLTQKKLIFILMTLKSVICNQIATIEHVSGKTHLHCLHAANANLHKAIKKYVSD